MSRSSRTVPEGVEAALLEASRERLRVASSSRVVEVTGAAPSILPSARS